MKLLRLFMRREFWIELFLAVWPFIYVVLTFVWLVNFIQGQYPLWAAVFAGSCFGLGWSFLLRGYSDRRRRSREHRRRRANHPGGTSGGSRAGIRSRRAREGDRTRVDAPDSAAPVVAFRTWTVGQVIDDGWRLTSCTRPVFWPPREPFVGRCLFPSDPATQGLQGPAETCSCGVYALKSATVDSGPVVGLVHLWGKVIEHEFGYRAQYAYPASLLVVSPFFKDGDDEAEAVANDLAARYGVRCVVASDSTEGVVDAQ